MLASSQAPNRLLNVGTLPALAVGLLIAPILAWADMLAAAHEVLAPAGPQAAAIADYWYLILTISGVVFTLILTVIIIAIWRAPRADAQTRAMPEAKDDPALRKWIRISVGTSIALLLVLIMASVWTDRTIAQMDVKDAVHIQVTAHQWWWEVRYDDPQASNIFTTANEMHIPAGIPVILTLKADDVIHSFWVPNLAGKKDLIPGRTATMRLRADGAGLYRGQCAEFCGFQHAMMAFTVLAEPMPQYQAWLANQRSSAPEPADPLAERGRTVFLGSSCAMCHAIQGTGASAIHGPDLTHIASRQTLAAGTLQNNPANLVRWITDPQGVKPGTSMPPTQLAVDDMQALVHYLRGLQ